MNIQRRHLLQSFAATAITAAAPQIAMAGQSIEDQMIPRMQHRFSADSLVLIDKPAARLKYIDRGRVVLDTPVLLGKQKSDDAQIGEPATPAGVFDNALLIRDDVAYKKLGDTVLAFQCKNDMSFCYSVHATYQGMPQENRPARLLSQTVEDNFISNGCPNIPPADFGKLLGHLEMHQAETGKLPYVVITPQRRADLPRFMDQYFGTKPLTIRQAQTTPEKY